MYWWSPSGSLQSDMITVMWWRDIITYIMVAWLEECALKKTGFLVLKEMDFYCKRMHL